MIDAAEFFADDITEPATIDGHQTRVFFDKKRYLIDNGFDQVVDFTPTVTCLTAFVETNGIAVDSVVSIRSTNYKVKEVEDDGQGVTILHLFKKR